MLVAQFLGGIFKNSEYLMNSYLKHCSFQFYQSSILSFAYTFETAYNVLFVRLHAPIRPSSLHYLTIFQFPCKKRGLFVVMELMVNNFMVQMVRSSFFRIKKLFSKSVSRIYKSNVPAFAF